MDHSKASKIPLSRKLASVDPLIPTLSTFRRLWRFCAADPRMALHHVEQWIVRRMAHSGLPITRLALGVVFLWFGLIKFLPTILPIDVLAEQILTILTFHLFQPTTCLHMLALFECLIGIGFLTGRFLHLTVLLLALQMPGTFLPLILLRDQTWVHFPYLPTFMGQYIIKNLVLVAAGIIVGSTVRGGVIIAHPAVAAKAKRVEIEVETKAFLEKEKSVS